MYSMGREPHTDVFTKHTRSLCFQIKEEKKKVQCLITEYEKIIIHPVYQLSSGKFGDIIKRAEFLIDFCFSYNCSSSFKPLLNISYHTYMK